MDDIVSALRALVGALDSLAIGGVAMAFLALAGIGSIAMAAVQVLKELTPWRQQFHRSRVRCWLADRLKSVEAPAKDSAAQSNADDEREKQIDELVHDWAELSVGGNLNALFDSPVEEMAAYMKQAAPVMLDEAERYINLIKILSLRADETDLDILFAGPAIEPRSDYFDARARIARRIDRNIDGLQVDTGNRWKFWMQLVSLATTALVVEGAVIAYGDAPVLTYVIAVPLGLLGGYFAPVIRDLVATLQKLRQA